MIVVLTVIASLILYVTTVRMAYRDLITREPWKVYVSPVFEASCSHGYVLKHRGKPCHKFKGTISEEGTRNYYLRRSLLGPAYFVPSAYRTLIGLGIFLITWKQPPSKTELRQQEEIDRGRRETLRADIAKAEADLAEATSKLRAAQDDA